MLGIPRCDSHISGEKIQVHSPKESDEVMKRLSWLLRIKCGRSLCTSLENTDYRKYRISWANQQNQYKFRPKSLVFLLRRLGIKMDNRGHVRNIDNTPLHVHREGAKIKMDEGDEKTEN